MSSIAGCHVLEGLVATAVQRRARVLENEPMARDTWRLKLACPDVARQIVPGQFFMIRDPKLTDPILGRPFALFDVWDDENGQPAGVEFGYLVVGKMTGLMKDWRSGDECEIWGPLGNGFPAPRVEHLCFVAGGIGQTPFLAAAREATGARSYGRSLIQKPQSVTLCYGARSKEYLAGVERFEETGINVRVSTDDGSSGHHGLVTDLLRQQIESPQRPGAVYCCGPERMMKAVADLCAKNGIDCWLSLETPMACGFGICFSCVTRVKMEDGSWDYRRTCVEGPVFRADQLVL